MITPSEIQDILNNPDPEFLESLAQKARRLTEQYFGRVITLYAPLYLSNYCSSHCTYCGFHSHHRIKRFKLSASQMRQEMSYLSGERIENILLLTGESYQTTPLEYLKEAVTVAQQYFSSISLEVHPMEIQEYQELFARGVDGITVYQETYDRERYKDVHISGTKADYDFRLQTAERAARAGMRHISLGILLGLADPAHDLGALYNHLRFLERNYPGVEYSLSFPRLKPIKGKEFIKNFIDDKTFTKIIALSRVLFPRVGINLSTREKAALRDHFIDISITRMSAGSNTSVGGYTLKSIEEQDPQFDVEDKRGVGAIIELLKGKNFDPVLTDWRKIT